MKKIYAVIILAAMATLSVFNAQGTVWNVVVLASSFSPSTLPGVVCGDTILWTLGSGSHTTTSTTIPAGATSWNAPINGSIPAFLYIVPNFPGVYNYECTPHGFTGSFTVTCSVGIIEEQMNISSAPYPSPFFSMLTVRYNNADEMRIVNVIGVLVKTIPLNIAETKVELHLDELVPGVYFCTTLKEGIIRETKRIVKTK